MLTKRYNTVLVDAQPYIEHIPAHTECVPDSPSGGGTGGHWEYVCEEICVPVGTDEQGETVYACGEPVCYSKWVPDNGGFGLG